MGEDTLEDRLEINKRVVGSNGSLALPKDAPDACFACSTNKEWNGVTNASFTNHIKDTHPDVTDTNTNPPDHTLMIEASIKTRKQQQQRNKSRKRKRGRRKNVSTAVHDTIITQLGDDDIRATGFSCKGARCKN